MVVRRRLDIRRRLPLDGPICPQRRGRGTDLHVCKNLILFERGRTLVGVDGGVTSAAIDELVWHMKGRIACALTGAGISTDSGIPDYRGPEGSLKKRSPVTYTEFVRSAENRRRYWARSCLGWTFMTARRPNDSHHALRDLQRHGAVRSIVTQNVDGLHQASGSTDVLELHGGLSRVVCLDCSTVSDRETLQRRMLRLNPGWLEATVEAAPDGDAELPPKVTAHFTVPPCEVCGGTLKPDVVFFGESVPKPRVQAAFDAVNESDILLVLGSSLTVYSGFRFADHAAKSGKTVAIVNKGPTRADGLATIKLDTHLGSLVPELARRLAPRYADERA